MKVWHVCGIYDSFQTRPSTLTRTMHYLKLLQRVFSCLSNFFPLSPAFPLVLCWVPKCGYVLEYVRVCWESGGVLCVWQAERPALGFICVTWINDSLECGWRPLVSPTNYSEALDEILAALDHPPSCAEMADAEPNKVILSPKSVFMSVWCDPLQQSSLVTILLHDWTETVSSLIINPA